jgi:8-oxo-dGTP diphosphatase
VTHPADQPVERPGQRAEHPRQHLEHPGQPPEHPGQHPVIKVAAAVIRNSDGDMLLVRKRGTTMFMNPGGKFEKGETSRQTLVRELHEEIGVVVTEDDLDYVGFFETDAANEPGHALEADVFDVAITGTVEPLAEIVELVWVDPARIGDLPIAPLAVRLIGSAP